VGQAVTLPADTDTFQCLWHQRTRPLRVIIYDICAVHHYNHTFDQTTFTTRLPLLSVWRPIYLSEKLQN